MFFGAKWRNQMKLAKCFRVLAVAFVLVLAAATIGEGTLQAAARPSFEVKKRNKKSVTIKIKKQGKVSGYQVFIASSKKGKYRQVGATKLRTYKITGLKKNKSYYIKIRSYKTKGYQISYGKYSKAKKVEKYSKKKKNNKNNKEETTPSTKGAIASGV